MMRHFALDIGAKLLVISAASLLPIFMGAPGAFADDAIKTAAQGSFVKPVEQPARSAGRTVAEPYLGTAPYICTPSGFGKRARCFYRASIRHHG